ncbi:MAG: acyl-CoA dehydrogenase family protein, partial [Hyphomicrobiales bacterium]
MSNDFDFDTHEVFNQPPTYENVNLFTSDGALQAAVKREGGAASSGDLEAFGALAGSAEMLRTGRLANDNPPTLKSFSPQGHRLDKVEFHPSYHQLMQVSCEAGMHCGAWEDVPGANVARAAIVYMGYQMEPGHTCPQVMTNACLAALKHAPDLEKDLRPRVMQRSYDGADKPMSEKSAITIGMGMTEKQGGSDVRTNTTRAQPTGLPGEYRIVGHKWFFSAPMCDGFLILAQAPTGLSCFFLPRYLPDGSKNPMHLMRLKEKLGNHANASSEVEFAGAHGWLVGEEGRGIKTILEMVSYTRVDCAVASAGLMRWGLANALHHTNHRTAFQKKLIDQPLMRTVLADLTLDSEAATALTFRLARCFDTQDDAFSQAFLRVMT